MTTKLSAVIIDDEQNNAELLHQMIAQYCNEIEVIGVAYGVSSGVVLVQEKQPNIIFLDIMMMDGSGFDLLDQLTDLKSKIIFTTAHEEFAIQAIKSFAVDYLLKPLSIEDVILAVNKAVNVFHNEWQKERKKIDQLKKLIAFPTQDGILFKQPEDIIWMEGSGAYTNVTFVNGEVLLLSKNIGDLEKKFEKKGFFRIHNSFIVNINQIKEYKRSLSHNLVMSDGVTLTISRRKKDDFLKLMTDQ